MIDRNIDNSTKSNIYGTKKYCKDAKNIIYEYTDYHNAHPRIKMETPEDQDNFLNQVPHNTPRHTPPLKLEETAEETTGEQVTNGRGYSALGNLDTSAGNHQDSFFSAGNEIYILNYKKNENNNNNKTSLNYNCNTTSSPHYTTDIGHYSHKASDNPSNNNILPTRSKFIKYYKDTYILPPINLADFYNKTSTTTSLPTITTTLPTINTVNNNLAIHNYQYNSYEINKNYSNNSCYSSSCYNTRNYYNNNTRHSFVRFDNVYHSSNTYSSTKKFVPPIPLVNPNNNWVHQDLNNNHNSIDKFHKTSGYLSTYQLQTIEKMVNISESESTTKSNTTNLNISTNHLRENLHYNNDNDNNNNNNSDNNTINMKDIKFHMTDNKKSHLKKMSSSTNNDLPVDSNLSSIPMKSPKYINSKFDVLRSRRLLNPQTVPIIHNISTTNNNDSKKINTNKNFNDLDNAAAVLSTLRSSPFKFNDKKLLVSSSSSPSSSAILPSSNHQYGYNNNDINGYHNNNTTIKMHSSSFPTISENYSRPLLRINSRNYFINNETNDTKVGTFQSSNQNDNSENKINHNDMIKDNKIKLPPLGKRKIIANNINIANNIANITNTIVNTIAKSSIANININSTTDGYNQDLKHNTKMSNFDHIIEKNQNEENEENTNTGKAFLRSQDTNTVTWIKNGKKINKDLISPTNTPNKKISRSNRKITKNTDPDLIKRKSRRKKNSTANPKTTSLNDNFDTNGGSLINNTSSTLKSNSGEQDDVNITEEEDAGEEEDADEDEDEDISYRANIDINDSNENSNSNNNTTTNDTSNNLNQATTTKRKYRKKNRIAKNNKESNKESNNNKHEQTYFRSAKINNINNIPFKTNTLHLPSNDKKSIKILPLTAAIRSRTGCWICRLRKKKCTEEKPNCSNCERLKLECCYNLVRPDFVSDPELKKLKLQEIKLYTREAKRNAMKKRTGSHNATKNATKDFVKDNIHVFKEISTEVNEDKIKAFKEITTSFTNGKRKYTKNKNKNKDEPSKLEGSPIEKSSKSSENETDNQNENDNSTSNESVPVPEDNGSDTSTMNTSGSQSSSTDQYSSNLEDQKIEDNDIVVKTEESKKIPQLR